MKIWNHFGDFYASYRGFKYFTFAHAQSKVTVNFDDFDMRSSEA